MCCPFWRRIHLIGYAWGFLWIPRLKTAIPKRAFADWKRPWKWPNASSRPACISYWISTTATPGLIQANSLPLHPGSATLALAWKYRCTVIRRRCWTASLKRESDLIWCRWATKSTTVCYGPKANSPMVTWKPTRPWIWNPSVSCWGALQPRLGR